MIRIKAVSHNRRDGNTDKCVPVHQKVIQAALGPVCGASMNFMLAPHTGDRITSQPPCPQHQGRALAKVNEQLTEEVEAR